MEKKLFGTLDTGEEIYIYTLEGDGATVEIINYGAAIKSFIYDGISVVGGYSSLSDYVADTSYQGATVGRVANRIEDATISLDGAIYMLTDNDNGSCLHGGGGYHKRVFDVMDYYDNSVTLSYYSPDGEDGFPEGLFIKVKYSLACSALVIEYEATPEGKTPIALTNHAHFNLNGFGDSVLSHRVKIYADSYTAVDGRLIPTGERPLVAGTPFDFREFHEIGERKATDEYGYDHNFILSPVLFDSFLGKKLPLSATVEGDSLRLSVYTDQPGLQFYTGNFLSGKPDFTGEIPKIKYGGFCLEAQTEPNCVKRGEAIYDAGMTYRQTTVYKLEKL